MSHWTADTMPSAVVLLAGAAWLAVALPRAVAHTIATVAEWLDRRHRRRVGEVFEDYQITYRVGSPPSHAAGGAR